MQPKSLEDLGVAVALNRPGPIEGGATETWMRRKRGEEPVTYMIPELEPILAHTYGAIIYQDQVMKIASAVAGFTLGEADILRAAMGKKDKVKMAKQREQFLSGAAARGVAADAALQLFDLIALFAGYGFNGAHSISYGLIAYQTAYLKANYPREYMCALLNSRADNFDKLKQSILDTHARGLVVRPPDINRSASAFSLGDADTGEILYGLRHIKNVGERVAAAIVAEREAAGPFASLFDLCLRVSSRDLNRRVVEALIRSGACDALGERGAMLAVLDRAIDRAASIRRERESGQTSLFGDAVVLIEPAAPPADEFDSGPGSPFAIAADERLRWEREFLGMYLSDHPLRRIAGELQQRVDTTINELGAHLDGLIVQVGARSAMCAPSSRGGVRPASGWRRCRSRISPAASRWWCSRVCSRSALMRSARMPSWWYGARWRRGAPRTAPRPRPLTTMTVWISSHRRSSRRRCMRMTTRALRRGVATASCTST